MKSKNLLFVVLAIIIIGAVFSVFYFSDSGKESNQDESSSFEPQGEGLPKQISVSTQEELFQEIRSAVDEHLNQ